MNFLGVVIEFADHVDIGLVKFEERTTFVDHPGQCEVGKVLVGVTTADVGVNTREPALLKVCF